jgi:hypothetical protein
VQERVVDQMNWYRRKGEHNGRITAWMRRTELWLGLLTVLMGAWASGVGNAPAAEQLRTAMPAASSQAVDAAASAMAGGAGLVRAPGMAASDAAPAGQPAGDAAGAAPDGTPTRPGQPSGWLALLALVAAATSAITAYLAASRHAELAAKYFATYDRLKDHLAEWRVAPDRDDPARTARFVDAVERTIAAEYGGWASDWAATRQAPK